MVNHQNKTKEILIRLVFILLVICLLYLSAGPLLKPGFYEIHDQTHFERLYEIDKCVRAGQFPCRIVPDFAYGYGYPIFNFYAPLAYYLGEIFHLTGFGFVDSIKLVFLLSIIISFIGMFLLSKEFWGNKGAFISSVIYLFTPYRAVNLYIRGALSELLALSFIPLVVYLFVRVAKKPGLKQIILASVGYALIMLSHNITSMVFSGFLILAIFVYFIRLKINKKPLSNTLVLIMPVVLGLMISSFFWIPAILEKNLVQTGSMLTGILDYRLHFPKISQIIYSKWTFGGSGANVGISKEDMSFQLGILNWLSIPAALLLIYKFRKEKKLLWIFIPSLLFLFFSMFLITSKSKFLWSLIPIMPYIQFPWRFLGWTTFFSSFLSGAVIFFLPKNWKSDLIILLIIVLTITININYFKSKNHFLIDEASYLNLQRISSGTTGVTDEYFPAWVREKPTSRSSQLIEIKSGKPIISDISTNFYLTKFNYRSLTNSKLIINRIYYPGFIYTFNNQVQKISYTTKQGLIELDLPRGEGQVVLKFTETPLRKTVNLISFITSIILIGSLFLPLKFSEKLN